MIKMSYQFIKVQKSIFDYKQYIKEVQWLKYDVKRRILDLLDKDFIVLEEFEESYDSLFIILYNKRLDIKIEITCKKSKKEIFV